MPLSIIDVPYNLDPTLYFSCSFVSILNVTSEMMSMSGARTYLSPGCRLLKLYLPGAVTNSNNRSFSTSHIHYGQTHYKLVIVGGGSGGSAIASKFARTLKKGDVAVVEPSEVSGLFFLYHLQNNYLSKFIVF